jgi:molecular chaperone DnaJ
LIDKNLYGLLNVDKSASDAEIKASFRKLSKKYHPDSTGNSDFMEKFIEIKQAYEILSDSIKKENYDRISIFGKYHDNLNEIFGEEYNLHRDIPKPNIWELKKNAANNILIEIDESIFDGKIEYERWVNCKACNGTGRDISSKILIKDPNKNKIKTFYPDSGCDFCEGQGTDQKGNVCQFCLGGGKIGLNKCPTCEGNRRILGKQKINGVKLTGLETKINSMGHFSISGKVGHLIIRVKK